MLSRLVLPIPSEEIFGKRITIINAGNNSWKITVLDDGKIGTHSEKNLSKNGQYIKIVCDGEKYYVI